MVGAHLKLHYEKALHTSPLLPETVEIIVIGYVTKSPTIMACNDCHAIKGTSCDEIVKRYKTFSNAACHATTAKYSKCFFLLSFISYNRSHPEDESLRIGEHRINQFAPHDQYIIKTIF